MIGMILRDKAIAATVRVGDNTPIRLPCSTRSAHGAHHIGELMCLKKEFRAT